MVKHFSTGLIGFQNNALAGSKGLAGRQVKVLLSLRVSQAIGYVIEHPTSLDRYLCPYLVNYPINMTFGVTFIITVESHFS